MRFPVSSSPIGTVHDGIRSRYKSYLRTRSMSCPGSSGSPTPKKDRTPTPGSSSAVVRKMLSSGLRPIGHRHQEGPVLGRETHLQLSLGFPNGILGSRLASGAEPDHGASGAPAGPCSRRMAAPPVWRTVSWRSRGTKSMVSVSSTWCQLYTWGVDMRPACWLARAASILRLPVRSGMSTLVTAYGLKSGNPSLVNAQPLGYLFPMSPDRWRARRLGRGPPTTVLSTATWPRPWRIEAIVPAGPPAGMSVTR